MQILGELSIFRSQLSIQRPPTPIIGSDGTVLEIVATDVADHIMLHCLSPSVVDLFSKEHLNSSG